MGKKAGSQASYPGGWKSRFHLSSSDFYGDGRDQKHPKWRLWSSVSFLFEDTRSPQGEQNLQKSQCWKKRWNKHTLASESKRMKMLCFFGSGSFLFKWVVSAVIIVLPLRVCAICSCKNETKSMKQSIH